MATPMMLAVAGLALGVIGLLVGVFAHARVGRLRRECVARAREAGVVDGATVDPRAIRNVSMIRYDAFSDMGGRLSFSLALLDSTGDGVVLSSINAHSETRTYAKVIESGRSTHDLSPEEEQALARARESAPVGAGHRDTTGQAAL